MLRCAFVALELLVIGQPNVISIVHLKLAKMHRAVEYSC